MRLNRDRQQAGSYKFKRKRKGKGKGIGKFAIAKWSVFVRAVIVGSRRC
jgi:hypothetical protein